MKFKFLFSLFLFCFTLFQLSAQNEAVSLLKEMHTKLNELRNGGYTAEYTGKLGKGNPVIITAKCSFERVQVNNDSAYIKYRFQTAGKANPKHSPEGFFTAYNGVNRFLLGNENVATVINSKKHPYWGTYMMGDLKNNLLFPYFFNAKKWTDDIDTTYQYSLQQDVKAGNDSCFVILIQKDSIGRATNYMKKITFRKIDLVPVEITVEMDWNETHQMANTKIYDLVLNDNKISINYSIDSIPSSYKLISFESGQSKQLLRPDTLMPSWKATTVKDSIFESSDLKSKVTLLAFWYMDCEPCIKAIPAMQELYNDYNSQGLTVIGMNPFDENNDTLKNFISEKKMNFPVTVYSKSVADKLNITAYPAFYIIDKSGKIIYSEKGYNKMVESEIRKKIKSGVKKK